MDQAKLARMQASVRIGESYSYLPRPLVLVRGPSGLFYADSRLTWVCRVSKAAFTLFTVRVAAQPRHQCCWRTCAQHNQSCMMVGALPIWRKTWLIRDTAGKVHHAERSRRSTRAPVPMTRNCRQRSRSSMCSPSRPSRRSTCSRVTVTLSTFRHPRVCLLEFHSPQPPNMEL